MFQTFPLSASLAVSVILVITMQTPLAAPAEFVAVRHTPDFVLPEIVFPAGEKAESVFDYEELSKISQSYDRYVQKNPALEAVRFLREGIERMTGKTLPVVTNKDKGIVLTTLRNAPPEVQNDPEVKKALQNAREDACNANEAFFIRTEPDRILIVANTAMGLNHAAAALLESVGYEVLGVGPNWTHVPDFHTKPLVFKLQAGGRPGFSIRMLGLTSGQGHGIGTLFKIPLPDPADETVDVSYNRWAIGSHIVGHSMPFFPGHVLQNYNQTILKTMRELNSEDGFLHKPGSEVAFKAKEGKTMVNEDGTFRSVKLDPSVPFVRAIILDDLKKKSDAHFKGTDTGSELFIFPTEPDDGVQPIKFIKDPQWYPDYLAKEGLPFGKPYVLDGVKGLKHPVETWDPTAFSDSVFGLNNWLLREYDKWIDSLPPEERLTKDGRSKKEMINTSLYSYNFHDVPPNFNPDPRIRAMIAGYPKQRGTGMWKNFSSQIDMAKAFQVMLPNQPSGDYTIPSFSFYKDFDTSGIRGSKLPKTIQPLIREKYDAGIRAVSMECDLNSGKMGLEYYLYAKILYNPRLTVGELDALRDRWLQRAFGSAWREMKAYYDFLAPENYTVNAPNSWGKAIRLLDAADHKIDPAKEPAAKLRIDDVKQFWFYYYLRESGQATADSPALKEFMWKGQMSYMTAMHMVGSRFFKSGKVRDIAGPQLASGPAHYTPEETAAWWRKVLDFWKVTPVANFADAVLSNGKLGREIEINDLVAVGEFQTNEVNAPFFYNSGSQDNAAFLSVASQAGQEIGFRLLWPFKPDDKSYGEKDIFYGISRWDSQARLWLDLSDDTMTSSPSRLTTGKDGKPAQLAEVRFPAPAPGTYRVSLGYGGELANLSSLAYDPTTGQASDAPNLARGFTFFRTLTGHSQGPAYIYIPKGVRSMDIEVWRAGANGKLLLHTGLPATGLHLTRTIEVGTLGTHTVKLEPGEDGSIATLEGGAIYFPFLYSVPDLWAKSTSQLLVPRQIAEADGLTILK